MSETDNPEAEKIGRSVVEFLLARFGEQGVIRLHENGRPAVHKLTHTAISGVLAREAWDGTPEAAAKIIEAMHAYCVALADVEALAKPGGPPPPVIKHPAMRVVH